VFHSQTYSILCKIDCDFNLIVHILFKLPIRSAGLSHTVAVRKYEAFWIRGTTFKNENCEKQISGSQPFDIPLSIFEKIGHSVV
jgi:hypothetical protein